MSISKGRWGPGSQVEHLLPNQPQIIHPSASPTPSHTPHSGHRLCSRGKGKDNVDSLLRAPIPENNGFNLKL